MRVLLLLVGLAHGADPRLAPTLQDLDASLDRATRLLARAAEAEDTLATAQLAWVDDRCPEGACPRVRVVDLVGDQLEAGRSLRADLQGARAELDRTRRMVAFAPLRSLLDPGRQARLDALLREVERRGRAYAARVAWTRAFVQPWATRAGVSQAVCPPEAQP